MNRRGFLKSIGKVGAGILVLQSVFKAKTNEGVPQCSCPAPYITDVSIKPTRHFDSCNISNDPFVNNPPKMYANIYNNKGLIVAYNLTVTKINGQLRANMPRLEKGEYTIHFFEANPLFQLFEGNPLWISKIDV